MYWIIIAALIVLAFAFLRLRHFKHKAFLILVIVLLLFFYITGSRVIAEHNIDLKSVSGIEHGFKVYFAWLGGAFDNVKVLTANAVNMDWTSKNQTEGIRIVEKK